MPASNKWSATFPHSRRSRDSSLIVVSSLTKRALGRFSIKFTMRQGSDIRRIYFGGPYFPTLTTFLPFPLLHPLRQRISQSLAFMLALHLLQRRLR